MKKNNIYPLPIELQKKISSESNYAMADFQEFTYRKNIKIIPDAIIGRYCKLFSIDKEKKIKLRLLIQDFVGHKQSVVVSALATWAALYKFKKIIYVSFKFTGFYISDTRQNVYNIIIPVEVHIEAFLLGDLNADGEIDILDVVRLVSLILNDDGTDYELIVSDLNEDGDVNIMDVVLLVQIILN